MTRSVLMIMVVLAGSIEAYADGHALLRSRSRNVVCVNNCNRFVQPNVVQHIVPQAAAHVDTTTTVVNNIVGIPVPVQYAEPLAAQGTTVYGYQSLSDYQNQVDMGLLYNQAARLTDQAQQLAGQAAVDFQTLVHAEGQYRSEVAKIIAQGQAAREALAAAKPEASQVTQRSFSFTITQNSDGSIKVEQTDATPSGDNPQSFKLISPQKQQQTKMDVLNRVSNLLTSKCVNCHNPKQSMGGLDLLNSISDEQQAKILARVVTDDEDKVMPRKSDGSPGVRLTQEEVDLLKQAMGQ